jgi:GTP-binding protein
MAEIKDTAAFHIVSSAYVRSAVNRSQYPDDLKPEIAFIGRSNVGKSSLINSLCGQRRLALVSREPGKTRTINYFAIQSRRKNEAGEEERKDWYLVDLPGYGFAKAAQHSKDMWSDFISDYLKKSPSLALICLLVDLRHPGLPIDQKAYDWLSAMHRPIQIIGTKSDKLGNSEAMKNLAAVRKLFPTERPPIAYSALQGKGRDKLLAVAEGVIFGE